MSGVRSSADRRSSGIRFVLPSCGSIGRGRRAGRRVRGREEHAVAGRLRWWLCGIGVVLAMVFAASAAAAAPSSASLVGTWTSWFTCTSECGGVYEHATVITSYSATTGDFSGTDSNGPVTGTVTGSAFSLHTLGGYHFSITGSIGSFDGYPCWSGFLVAENGSGPWIGSLDPKATQVTLKHCGPGACCHHQSARQLDRGTAHPRGGVQVRQVRRDRRGDHLGHGALLDLPVEPLQLHLRGELRRHRRHLEEVAVGDLPAEPPATAQSACRRSGGGIF